MVVALIGLFLTIAVPSFGAVIANNAVTAAANELVASLNRARNEAVTRGVAVRVCPRGNADQCAGTDWSTGWVVVLSDFPTDPVEFTRIQRVNVTNVGHDLEVTARGFLVGSAVCFDIDAPAATRNVSVRVNRFGIAEAAQGGCS